MFLLLLIPRIFSDCASLPPDPCPLDLPICDIFQRTCVGCESDLDCRYRYPNRPICQLSGPDTGKCRACTANDCPSDYPICETNGENAGSCRRCVQSDCSADKLICSPATFDCIECNTYLEGKVGTRCSTHYPDSPFCGFQGLYAGKCTVCTDDDCYGETPYCEKIGSGKGKCRGCKPSDCSGPSPICDPANGKCTRCDKANMLSNEATTCSTQHPNEPICERFGNSGYCRPCYFGECKENTPICSCKGNLNECDGEAESDRGRCRACKISDCYGDFPICNLVSGNVWLAAMILNYLMPLSAQLLIQIVLFVKVAANVKVAQMMIV